MRKERDFGCAPRATPVCSVGLSALPPSLFTVQAPRRRGFQIKRELVGRAEALTVLPRGSLILKDISGTRCHVLAIGDDGNDLRELVKLQRRQLAE